MDTSVTFMSPLFLVATVYLKLKQTWRTSFLNFVQFSLLSCDNEEQDIEFKANLSGICNLF